MSLTVLSASEAIENEKRTWDAMKPGKLVTLQNLDCTHAGPCLVKEKKENSIVLIQLGQENVQRILAGQPCLEIEVGRNEGYFSNVTSPREYDKNATLGNPLDDLSIGDQQQT